MALGFWNDARVENLKHMWKHNMSASTIASCIGDGCTRNMVMGKVFRLCLSANNPTAARQTLMARERRRNNTELAKSRRNSARQRKRAA